MSQLWKDIVTALLMGALLPGLMLNGADYFSRQSQEPPPVREPQSDKPVYPMRLHREDGTVEVMNMDEYLVWVVLAEMPASFEEEALKAQAVAARTYTQKAYETGGKHGDNAVCTDPGCCQGAVLPREYLDRGGSMEDLAKITAAVEATSGQVLTYNGSLIEATYFSCSGGSTEDAAAVWGTAFPYLQAVPSPGEEGASHYEDTVTFTPEEFAQALGMELTGAPESWFGEPAMTEGGGVRHMEIGGRLWSGTRLRSLLGLRSTAFTIEAGETVITITTRGFGHRVGMSQYGADAMAALGHDYREILAHYYPGTVLEEIR